MEVGSWLVKGEFLAEDHYSDWARARRETLRGKMGECVYALADLYMKKQQPDRAREVLWDMLEVYPSDQDALSRLMLLLETQGRYHAAWQLYKRAKETLTKDDLAMTPRTQALAKRVRGKLASQELPPVEENTFHHQPAIHAVLPVAQFNEVTNLSLSLENQIANGRTCKEASCSE